MAAEQPPSWAPPERSGDARPQIPNLATAVWSADRYWAFAAWASQTRRQPGGASAWLGVDLATTEWTGRMDRSHGQAAWTRRYRAFAAWASQTRRQLEHRLSEDLIWQPQHGLANTGLFAARASQTKHQPEHQPLQSNPERITTHGGICPPVSNPATTVWTGQDWAFRHLC